MKICSIENCDRKVKSRGWCAKHYSRWQDRKGDPGISMVPKKKTCKVENCGKIAKAKLLCQMHYVRFQKHGDHTKVLPQVKRTQPLEIRLMKYVIKDEDPNKCWKWTGNKRKTGYGVLRIKKKTRSAHRVSYELYNGEIDNNLFVCHSCDNRECCNPKHLWLGTNKDNTDDRDIKGRCKSNKGINNPRAKLNENDVISIKQRLKNGDTLTSLAKEYNLTKTSIGRIKREKAWKHITI